MTSVPWGAVAAAPKAGRLVIHCGELFPSLFLHLLARDSLHRRRFTRQLIGDPQKRCPLGFCHRCAFRLRNGRPEPPSGPSVPGGPGIVGARCAWMHPPCSGASPRAPPASRDKAAPSPCPQMVRCQPHPCTQMRQLLPSTGTGFPARPPAPQDAGVRLCFRRITVDSVFVLLFPTTESLRSFDSPLHVPSP